MELVDAIVGGTPAGPGPEVAGAPSGEPSADPISSSTPGEQGGADQTKEWERKAKHWRRKLEDAGGTLDSIQTENRDLRDRLARLEGQVAGSGTNGANGTSRNPSGWGDLSDDDLQDAYTRSAARQNAETGEWEAGNPQAQAQSLREMMRRSEERGATRAGETFSENLAAQNRLQSANTGVLQKYGAEASDSNSELWQTADRYVRDHQRQHGDDVLLKQPALLMASFDAAFHDLHAGDREQLRALETQVEKLKAAQALTAGTAAGAALNSQSKEALGKGDLKGAIRGLGMIQRLGG